MAVYRHPERENIMTLGIPGCDPDQRGNSRRSGEKSAGLRVLIVDDEPLIRWSLAETLADCGHIPSEAGDGTAAVQFMRDHGAPDVVLLDYRLPDSNDLTLLTTIRCVAPGAAVIMMTAYGTSEITTRALELGVFRVLMKPFEVHDISGLVLQAYASARH
jgi:two-component system response regulator AtoC